MKNIRNKLKEIPKNPGTYIFKDKNNNIIYIGKALNLSNRVNSYFSGTRDIKTSVLVKKIHDIEYIITANEAEALLLENNLIKKHKPRYNIQLKDAKSYPMLKIINENIPRIIKCREKYNNKDEYFGPFISVEVIRQLQLIFTKVLKLRSCKIKFKPPYNYTPCLYYYIDKCSAPCASFISIEEYLKNIDVARNILKGNTNEVLEILEKEMEEHSAGLEFERAAKIRDQVKLIREYTMMQFIDTQSTDNCDYIGIYNDFRNACISIIQERNGKVIGKENFMIKSIIDYSSILVNFLSAYYFNITQVPQLIYVPEEFDEMEALKTAIKMKFNIDVEIKKPDAPKNKRILILAKENADIYFEENQYKLEKIHVLRELKKILNMPKIPRVIEGIDVATLDGKFNTGALVTFKDGKPDKVNYRQFNIDNQAHPDDYTMIHELVTRRYSRIKNEGKTFPDLILVDGGKGQVSVVKESLTELGLDIKMIGLAKKNEYIFTTDSNDPLILPRSSNSLKLLQRVRDEAHRFSNTRLRNRYSKKNLESKLLKIQSLGEKRVNDIFKRFGSIKGLMDARVDQISEVDNIGSIIAGRIYQELHAGED